MFYFIFLELATHCDLFFDNTRAPHKRKILTDVKDEFIVVFVFQVQWDWDQFTRGITRI